jgi:hypothetical protein
MGVVDDKITSKAKVGLEKDWEVGVCPCLNFPPQSLSCPSSCHLSTHHSLHPQPVVSGLNTTPMPVVWAEGLATRAEYLAPRSSSAEYLAEF